MTGRLWRGRDSKPAGTTGEKLDRLVREESQPVSLHLSLDPERLRMALASGERRRQLPAGSAEELIGSLRDLRIEPVNQFCADILLLLRPIVAKVEHGALAEQHAQVVAPLGSIDFALALLEGLPGWLLYTTAHWLDKALGCSVQTALVDMFWGSALDLLAQLRRAAPNRDRTRSQCSCAVSSASNPSASPARCSRVEEVITGSQRCCPCPGAPSERDGPAGRGVARPIRKLRPAQHGGIGRGPPPRLCLRPRRRVGATGAPALLPRAHAIVGRRGA